MATLTVTSRSTKRTTGNRTGAAVRSWVSRIWPSLTVFIGALVLWELAVELLGISSFVIAKPSAIAAEAWASKELLLHATWVTTQEIVYGFAISIAVGVVLAVSIARFSFLDRAIYPLIILFQVVPKVALAPIFILWFGFGLTPKLMLVVVIAFFPITLNMLVGLKNIDPDLLLVMRSVGATRNQILTRIQIPTSLPYLFAGLRIAITFSVIGAIVAEFAGASDGLGYLIQFSSVQLDTPLMFAALAAVSILGLLMYYGMSIIEFAVARRFPHIKAAE